MPMEQTINAWKYLSNPAPLLAINEIHTKNSIYTQKACAKCFMTQRADKNIPVEAIQV